MFEFGRYGRTFLGVLLATLLTVVFVAAAKAEEDVEKKVAELEAKVKGLENLLKTLSLQLQEATEAFKTEMVNVGPRLFAIEKLSKDLSFDLKKNESRLMTLEETVGKLAELVPKVASLQENVKELAGRVKNTELGLSKLAEAVDKLGGLQNLVVGLHQTVGGLQSRLEADEKKMADLQASMQSSVAELTARLEKAEMGIGKLGSTVDPLKDIPSVLMALQNNVGGLTNRIERAEVRVSRVVDITEQLSGLQPVVAKLQERVEEIEKRIGVAPDTELAKKVQKLQEALGTILADLEATKMKLAEVETKVMPDLAAIEKEIEEGVAAATKALEKRLKEAESKAAAANNLALLGLLAGIAGIVLRFVF